jgi:hypothetical protein
MTKNKTSRIALYSLLLATSTPLAYEFWAVRSARADPLTLEQKMGVKVLLAIPEHVLTQMSGPDGKSEAKDAMNKGLGKLFGKGIDFADPIDREDANYQARVDRTLEAVQETYGDAARLKIEQQMRRDYSENPELGPRPTEVPFGGEIDDPNVPKLEEPPPVEVTIVSPPALEPPAPEPIDHVRVPREPVDRPIIDKPVIDKPIRDIIDFGRELEDFMDKN